MLRECMRSVLSGIKLDNVPIELFSTTISIKQGNSLSPSLFNVFINENVGTDPVSLNERKLDADDILLLSKTPNVPRLAIVRQSGV